MFSEKFISMARDRFFIRMGYWLPDRSSRVYWHLLLPTEFGGLGLWLQEDLKELPFRLPDPTKTFIKDRIAGTATSEINELFKGFSSNCTYRGYSLCEDPLLQYVDSVIDQIRNDDLLPYAPLAELAEAYKVSDRAILSQITFLRKANWWTLPDLKQVLLRPILFQQMLERKVKNAVFNTVHFKERYSRLWNLTFRGHCSVTESEILESFNTIGKEMFYFAGDKILSEYRGEPLVADLINTVTKGLPVLAISYDTVGVLTKPTGSIKEEFLFDEAQPEYGRPW
jgi:hypothetical protein